MKVTSNEWNAQDVTALVRKALATAHPDDQDLDSPQPVKLIETWKPFSTGTFGPPETLRLVVGSHGQEFLVTITQKF